jgi:hypothetical protein
MKTIRIDMTFIAQCADGDEIHIKDVEEAVADAFDVTQVAALSTPTYLLTRKGQAPAPEPEECPSLADTLLWTSQHMRQHENQCPHTNCRTKVYVP